MLLTGAFFRAVDDKRRVAIPKRLRMALGSGQDALYVTLGTDGSLVLYSEESFSAMADKLSNSSPTAPDVRAFSRLFFARAQRVEVDRQGRVRIPAELAELIGLTNDAVLLGVRDHMEVWDRGRWDDYQQAKQREYDLLAERAFGPPHKTSGTSEEAER